MQQSLYQSTKLARGFTLVELLVVIFLLSSLALATTFLVDSVDEQARFDETKSRLMQIRRAIIGDSSRTLNGAPEISGFVADMGRLPTSLEELVVSAETWELLEWTPPVELSGVLNVDLYGGWRGPYIDTLPGSDGTKRYRDGWANDDASVNFGWLYQLVDMGLSSVAIEVQSLGADGVVDVSAVGYDAEYPKTGAYLVVPEDHEVTLNGLKVRFNKPINSSFSADDSLFLRLYFVNDGAIDMVESDDGLLFAGISGVGGLSGVETQSFTFDNATNSPFYFGHYAAVLLCRTSATPITYVVFDGNCDATQDITPRPVYFSLIPRGNLPTLQWNIQ